MNGTTSPPSARQEAFRRRAWGGIRTLAVVVGAAVAASSAAAAGPCPICGKNLIKNPGAETGAGVTAVDARGVVPGWTNVAGQFGAASYSFPNGWFSATSKGSPTRGKNYFFGGTTSAAVQAPSTVGKQTIALPVTAVGRKATLSGWLGNYTTNTTQVRAEFADASGKVLASIGLGPDTTISGTDMAARSRSGIVPAGTTQVTVVVKFTGGNNYKLAGADDLALVLR